MMPPPKPTTVPVICEHIPPDLTAADQWVVWRWTLKHTMKNGKLTLDWGKPPLTITGTAASSTDPTTWATFAQALAALRDPALQLDGIGRVVTAGEGLVGVDLDKCIAADGTIAPWAHEIVQQLDSYTEHSPSGRGLRVWVHGTLPPGRRKKGQIEVYSDVRYFTVTGARLPERPATIEARPAEILALHHQVFGEKPPRISPNGQPRGLLELDDAALLERARHAKNGAKFTRLFDAGDTTGFASPSEADAALCAMLAFWCRHDAPHVDRLFRMSALYRDKWDERRGEQTYGERTLAGALALGTEDYAPSGTSTRSAGSEADDQEHAEDGEGHGAAGEFGRGGGELDDVDTQPEATLDPDTFVASGLGDALLVPPAPEAPDGPRGGAGIALRTRRLSEVTAKPIDWVWRARYARGYLTGLFGDGGMCKSTFDLTVMARLTTGRPMPFETATRPPGTCVILSLEDDAETTLKPRFIAAGGDPDRLVLVESIYNPRTGTRVRQVELERDLELLRAKLIEVQAVHFTISPVSAYLGSTRNSWKDSDVRAIIDPLHEMAARLKISGTLVAHPNKNAQQRAAYRMSGSQAFRNACRIVLVIGLDPADATHERLVIVGEKRNIAEIAPPLAFHKVVQTYTIDNQQIEAVSLDFDLDQDLDRLQYTADYVLTAPPDTEEQAEIEVAKDFLAQTLGTAAERTPSQAVQQAAAGLGISRRTLERARKLLKVRAEKTPDGWALWIPPKDHPVNRARRMTP